MVEVAPFTFLSHFVKKKKKKKKKRQATHSLIKAI